MSPEVYPNTAIGFLNGAITSTATSITFQAGHSFPASGNYMIKIDNEIIQVTGVSSNVATVVRAQEGTAGASHTDGTIAFHVITQGGLNRINDQLHNGTIITQRRRLNFVDGGGVTWSITDNPGANACDVSASVSASSFEASLTAPPAVGSWSWINQLTATLANPGYGGLLLMLASPSTSTRITGAYMAAPAAPYTLVAKLTPKIYNGNNYRMTIGWYDSASGKIQTFLVGRDAITVENFTNFNTDTSTAWSGQSLISGVRNTWIKLVDDGTSRKFYYGDDGENWFNVLSESRTTFLTPDSLFFGVDVNVNAGVGFWPSGVLVESWNVTSP
jgi:hypothetical protein